MILAYKTFINTIVIALYAYMAHVLYNYNLNVKSLIRFIFATAVIGNILFFAEKYIGMEIKAMAVVITMIAMAFFVLRLKFLQSIVSAIVFNIALAVGDISAVSIMVSIYGYTIDMIKSDFVLSITADLIIYGSVVLIIFLIRLVKQAREITDKYKRILSVRTSVYMLATFFIVVANYSMYIKCIGTVENGVILSNVALMWLYLVLSLYINFTISDLAFKEQQYDQQQDYIRTIDNLVNDFRRMKHSYTNIIYSIYGYLQEDDMEGLKEYFKEIMEEAKKMDNSTLLAMQRIKVYAIFGLVWSKINEAESVGLNVGIHVSGEVCEAGMKLKDLCEVLGNYLDNAIEAAAASEGKKLNIYFADDGSYLSINIENTYSGSVDISKVYEKGYSTKGENRGYGLSFAKQILDRYTNILSNTHAENGIFKQELVIKK